MESEGSAPTDSSAPFAPPMDNSVGATGGSGDEEETPIEMIDAGKTVVVIIKYKSLLHYLVEYLGIDNEPVFTEINSADNGYKYSVKLDVSGFPSLSGQSMPQSIVFGSASLNQSTAQDNAAFTALKYLHDQHLIRFTDFSSRVADNLNSYNTFDLVIEGMRSLQKVFLVWDKTLSYSQNFADVLSGKKFDEVVATELTDKGELFDLASEPLSQLLGLHERSAEANSEMVKVQDDISKFEKYIETERKRITIKGDYYDVDLSSKDVLEYVLGFLQLNQAEYTSRAGHDGYVNCEVKIIFPLMEKYKFGGAISIQGKGVTSLKAQEDASFQALLFIEKHFPVKIIDYNHGKRKKASNQQTSFVIMLSKIIEVAQELKNMWSQLSHLITSQQSLFSFDAKCLAIGGMSEPEVDAFNFCARGFGDIGKYSANSYDSCAAEFDSFVTLSWKLHDIKIKLHK